MTQHDNINAEVISVFPNKVRISVDDLNDFQLAEENFYGELSVSLNMDINSVKEFIISRVN